MALSNSYKAAERGLYLITLGNTLFTEEDGKFYLLHAFPFKTDAMKYRDDIDKSVKNPFSVVLWDLKRLYNHYKVGSIRNMYISIIGPDGNVMAQDLLFANSSTIVH
jgi:hypothetical protein